MHFQISSIDGAEYELYLGSSKHPEAEFIGGVPLDRAWSLRFVTPHRIHSSPSSTAGWNITTLLQPPSCQTLLKGVSLLYTIYALHLKQKKKACHMEMMMEIAKNMQCDVRKMKKEVTILYNTTSRPLPSQTEFNLNLGLAAPDLGSRGAGFTNSAKCCFW